MLQYPHTIPAENYTDLLKKIEIRAGILLQFPSTTPQRDLLVARNILKSSLFSARIEGNTLTIETYERRAQSEGQQKQEVLNIHAGLEHYATSSGALTQADAKKAHEFVMHKLPGELGFRTEQTGIFDQAGHAVYLTPPVKDMLAMLDIFLEKLATPLPQIDRLINAIQSHYFFEKIHPFVDGNGRTGRILFHHALHQTTLFGGFVLPIEQFIDEHRLVYYRLLEKNTRKVEDFVAFFLEGILWAINMSIDQLAKGISQKTSTGTPHMMSPRRQEMLAMLRDHPFLSFDGIVRRFPSIPRTTLTYDVYQLIKQGYVIKYGITRGACYSAAPPSAH